MSLKLVDRTSGAEGPELHFQVNTRPSRDLPKYEVSTARWVLDAGELLAALAKIGSVKETQYHIAELTHYWCSACLGGMRCHQLYEDSEFRAHWVALGDKVFSGHFFVCGASGDGFTADQTACMIHWLLWNVTFLPADDDLRVKVAPIEGKLRELAARLAAKPLPAVF
ncbi:MAG: hypothetical protein AAB731_01085 [Patescibacteria group bacterium]